MEQRVVPAACGRWAAGDWTLTRVDTGWRPSTSLCFRTVQSWTQTHPLLVATLQLKTWRAATKVMRQHLATLQNKNKQLLWFSSSDSAALAALKVAQSVGTYWRDWTSCWWWDKPEVSVQTLRRNHKHATSDEHKAQTHTHSWQQLAAWTPTWTLLYNDFTWWALDGGMLSQRFTFPFGVCSAWLLSPVAQCFL